jgi:hypothetical protein
MNVELHIEQLILHHCAPRDRQRFGATLRREVERLISERGLSPSLPKGADIAWIVGGTLQVGHGATVESRGGEIARAAYEGMLYE